jgi:sugar (pentulose or hexulose) kinase
VAELGRDKIHAISGKPPTSRPASPAARWFAEKMPPLWAKTAMTAEVHGVVTHFLTGRWATSTASADPMGLLDVKSYDWSDELIAAAGLTREQLPQLFRPGESWARSRPQPRSSPASNRERPSSPAAATGNAPAPAPTSSSRAAPM